MRLLLAVTLLLITMGVGSGGERLPGICFPKVESRHFGDRHYSYIGTGTFISDRLVLTCQHNVRDHVQGQTKLYIEDEFGDRYNNVIILREDPDRDLALLKVLDRDIRPHGIVDISTENVWYQGPVKAVGYWGSKRRYHESTGRTDGGFAGASRSRPERTYFTHTAATHQGMSGGPVINDRGELIGVTMGSAGGLGYASGVPVITEFLR